MISTELERIIKAKGDMKAAIERKGVVVAPDALISAYPDRIAEIKGDVGIISVKDTGLKFENSKWSRVPDRYDFTGVTDYAGMFALNRNLTELPAGINLTNTTDITDMCLFCEQLKTPPVMDYTKGVNMRSAFQGSGITSFPYLIKNTVERGLWFTFANCPNLEYVEGFEDYYGYLNLEGTNKLTYEALRNIACTVSGKYNVEKTVYFSKIMEEAVRNSSAEGTFKDKGWSVIYR